MDEPPERGSLRPLYTEKVGKSFKEGTGDEGRGAWDEGRGTRDVGRGTWRGTPTVYCSLFTVHYSLLPTLKLRQLKFTIRYLLFTVYCLLFTIHCSLLPQLNF